MGNAQLKIQAKTKQNSREALLEAAEYLFTTRGYIAVSTRELADYAGVNLGAIQYHFGSKVDLFVETTKRLMAREPGPKLNEVLAANSKEHLKNPTQCAIKIAEFIHTFLEHLLRPSGPQACRMMFREVFSEAPESTELIKTLVALVVKEFITPVDKLLQSYIAALKPKATKKEIEFCVQSIIGQCTYYITHMPFIANLRKVNVPGEPFFTETVKHVTTFSLQALGCDQKMIKTALQKLPTPKRNVKVFYENK